MTSGMHDQTLQWQFTEINHRRLIQVTWTGVWCMDTQPAKLLTMVSVSSSFFSCVQVEQYPPLTSTRNLDGSWRLDNHYVWFEQVRKMW